MIQEVITYIILLITFTYTAYKFIFFFISNNKNNSSNNSACSNCSPNSCEGCAFNNKNYKKDRIDDFKYID